MLGTNARVALCVFVLAYFINYYYNTKVVDSPIIHIQNGKLRGIIEKSRNERNYFSFMGIPYGQPPIHELRFEAPKPFLKSWNGVRDASSFGSQCLQYDLIAGRVAGDEDCLFLNVFTPKLENKGDALPVMVFIHGGSFLTGSPKTYNPKYFMDEEVVIVTINYRLGALGFLNTGDGVIHGNMGLKDQTMALKWIQQNIVQFGGDSNSITIFGNSAGGASCHFHVLSPLSKGLFHRAISQSGTAISHWATYPKPKEQAERFAGLLNCQRNNSTEMVACLKRIKPFDLVDVHKEVMTPLRDYITLFVPTVEKVINENTFLPADPYELILKGNYNKIPWMAGINSHEGLLYSAGLYRNDTLVKRIQNNFNDVAGRLLDINPTNSKILQRIHDFYLGNEIKDNSHIIQQKQFQNLTNLFSDRSFFIPLHKSVEIQRIHSPIYLYYYSYERDISIAKYILAAKGNYPIILEIAYEIISSWIKYNIFWMEIPKIGVCHTDELGIFFPVLWDSDINQGGKHYDMSKDIIKLWVSFANQKTLEFRNTHWLQVDSKSDVIKYIKLDYNSTMLDPPFTNRIAFWNSIKLN